MPVHLDVHGEDDLHLKKHQRDIEEDAELSVGVVVLAQSSDSPSPPRLHERPPIRPSSSSSSSSGQRQPLAVAQLSQPALAVEAEEVSHVVLAIVVLHLVAGAAYTLAISWQNMMTINGVSFSHPYIQTFVVLAGQGLNLPISMLIDRCCSSDAKPESPASPSRRNLSRDEHRRTQTKIFVILFVTSITETLECLLGIVALTMMDASVFSMLRITQLLFAAFLQKVIIPCIKSLHQRRRVTPEVETQPFESETRFAKYTASEYFGLFMIVVGVFLVFLSRQSWFPGVSQTSSSKSNDAVGVVLLLSSMAILAAQAAAYEYILTQYPEEVTPLQLIGYQGVWSTAHSLLVVIVVYQVVGMESENPQLFLQQLRDGGWAPATAVVLSCIGVTVTDATGTVLTKKLSANTRPALQPIRTAMIWLFSLAVNLIKFNPMQLAGFGISTVGSLLFKKMIHLPSACC
jgi:hypothetical protein